MPRLFVAVALGESLRQALTAAAARVPPWPGLRRVPAENLHVTLRFLGSVEAVAPVVAAVREAAAGTAPDTLEVVGLGSFPAGGFPRVLWAGVRAPWLAGLARRLEEALGSRGFPPEPRPFRPHVTLARVRPGNDPKGRRAWWSQVRALLAAAAGERFGTEAVRSVAVMESLLRPDGARYVARARVPLGLQADG